MEPGLRDREYADRFPVAARASCSLQWSPVLETGNTRSRVVMADIVGQAAMEPGLRDREYGSTQNPLLATSLAGLRERCQPSPGQGDGGAPAGGGKHGSD